MAVVIDGDIVGSLLELGISPAILADFPTLPDETSALLVYGSQARGDAIAGSDLDLLALVDTARPSTYVRDINISYYTPAQLATAVGTLFGAHLRRDSKVIADANDALARAVEAMGDVDTDRLFDRVWRASELFVSPEHDLPKYLRGLLRQARYLLRSCLYAQAIAAGDPCFSVRELAVRHGDPALADILSSRHSAEPAASELDDCLTRLRLMVGEFPSSQNGSLEATIVNEWERPGDLLSMAFLALGTTGAGADYAEVEKVLL